jgi:1-acyl-sn-glycerol-3-phosphate acyltransferase
MSRGVLGHLVYRAVAPLARLAVRAFFRRVEVRGQECIPAGPVVVGANHPNMFLDPLLVGISLYPRQIHFLAKAPLFKIPVAGQLFHLLGVLPVFRKQDDPGKMDQNKGMFSACIEALHAGESIGIFPEGVSAAEPWLQPLKTGAARILLEAAVSAPRGQAMHLLPVGLNYAHRTVFRSDVLILFGPPLDPRDYLDTYQEDPRAAARSLTEDLDKALHTLTCNLARVEDERVIDRLERVYRSDILPVGEDLEERFYLSRNIVDGFEHFRSTSPEKVARVERQLEVYFFGLEAFDLAGAHLANPHGYSLWRVLLFLLRTLPLLVVAAPFALYGTLMGFVPYNLTDPLARRGAPGPEELATNKVLWGAVLFGLFYGLQTLLVLVSLGWPLALGYALTLIPCGLLGIWWIEKLRNLLRHGRTFWLFVRRRGFRERMARIRRELLRELEQLSEEYLRLREKESLAEGEEGDQEEVVAVEGDPSP